MIEGSKSFAKQVMAAAGIPTAAARTCTTEGEAMAALARVRAAVRGEGRRAGRRQGRGGHQRPARRPWHTPGRAGTVVIEEYLDGPEVSLFALADGTTAVPLLPAQDFKRAGDGDAGPNTGGMGAYAPLPWAPPGPGRRGRWPPSSSRPSTSMRRRGTPYRGPAVRRAEPDHGGRAGGRVQRPVRRPGDPGGAGPAGHARWPALLAAAADGAWPAPAPLRWRARRGGDGGDRRRGLPRPHPANGDEITDIDEAERVPGAHVLHAGTADRRGGQLVSAGGRVLNVVGAGPDLAAARAAAYRAAGAIRMRGGWYRHDIAEAAAFDQAAPAVPGAGRGAPPGP